jgi:hypothetical protein
MLLLVLFIILAAGGFSTTTPGRNLNTRTEAFLRDWTSHEQVAGVYGWEMDLSESSINNGILAVPPDST